MANQISPDFDKIYAEGLDLNFYVKSKRAFNDIQKLIKEAKDKGNMDVMVSNVARLNDMVKYYMDLTIMLDGRIRYYQKANQATQIENEDLIQENFLLIAESKGREHYKNAKERLDKFFDGQ